MHRHLLAVAAVSLVFLTACGTQPPPADELANELIDTLDVSQEVKDCMHGKVDGWELSEADASGFSGLDDVAAKAADGQERAIEILQEFQDSLASCN